ncbi:efflux RND transporter periplasmic adaptor subunit [Nocardiopsis sp. N85]|uniref:HlyD family efflux transporter periplasmic adaptor subunit n=1 Tax=Nocardiopsis sp. N85 TaxID=3029400 RepID=UPI00237F4577|nr:efflux RND transporter periplasmic adaptor subunit [Nocardiopsis sp. N85]MDE3721064.1 efflux RND transporter periplasmic adaptor subunit [Nocardiopsis sp. N85]
MKKWIIIGAAALLFVIAIAGSGYFLMSRLGGSSGEEFLSDGALDVNGVPHPVELGTVDSVMVLDATVQAEPGRSVKAKKGGQVAHLWVTDGAEVEQGAPIINVKITEESAAGGEGEEAAAPVTREVSLYAPVSGKVSGLADVEVGDVLEPGAVVASVAPDVYRAVATIPANDLYRFYEEPKDILLEIKNGPPPAQCDFLSLGAARGDGEEQESTDEFDFSMEEGGGGGGGGGELACRVPSDTKVFEGVQGKLSISTGKAEDVIVVPVTSVRGTTGSGEVIVIAEDGTEETREVELGVSDGSLIEVVSGVEVGEQVMDPIPLDPRFDVPGADEGDDEDYLLEEEGM